MSGLRNWISLQWPVVAVAAVTGAVAVGFQVTRPDFTFDRPPDNYPIWMVLPAARPPAHGPAAMPASTGVAVYLPPDADPFESGGERAALAAAAADGAGPRGDAAAAGDLRGGLARRVAAGGPGAAPAPAATRAGGLLAVDFDLSRPYDGASIADDGEAIDVRKPVRLNGAEAGSATVRVTPGSTLLMAREELGRLLARAGLAELAGQVGSGGYVSFDDMRDKGITVRYDPVTDRLLVST